MFAALFAFNVYRAAMYDVTPAEAWNYDRYIGVPWQESLKHFEANNHVLNTLLVRISTSSFHLTELSLRLPALLCGVLYVWAVWRLCGRLFSGGAVWVASAALMTLNPLVVDALSEARGYGMAMAAWLWALALMLECLESFSSRKLNLAAVCLALSVASCPTFIVPVLGLVLAFSVTQASRPAFGREPSSLARDLFIPALICAFVLLAIPLNHVLLSELAGGATSLRQTLAELTSFSLAGLAVNPRLLAAVVRIGLGLLLIAAAVAMVRRRREDPLLLLTGSTAWIGGLILLAAHYKIKSPFPQRGAIYFIPVLTLTGLALLRPYRDAMLTMSAACILIYLAGFPAGPYLEGREYEGSREIAKALRADAKQRPVRIATSLELEPVMNYYRTRYGQANWERVARKTPEAGYDYYVLTGHDATLLDRLHLHVIRREGSMSLAKP